MPSQGSATHADGLTCGDASSYPSMADRTAFRGREREGWGGGGGLVWGEGRRPLEQSNQKIQEGEEG